MLRIALLAMCLVGCASQPHASLPPSNEEAVVAAPESEPETAATDLAMFAERFTRAVALIVSGFLAPDYQATE